ncbi:MAG TPA: response regulator [Flavobacterium sp.]|nr:response regulator [Flavobacterium sp.]
MKVRLLIIEDHPAMIAGYESILSLNTSGYNFEIITAHDCEGAYKIISNPQPTTHFDIIFLDIILPAFLEKNIQSGQDIAKLARFHTPNSKIIMLTSHTEAFVLYQIVKSINPEGLLVKSDFTPAGLLHAFEEIMDGQIYHSETVRKSFKELLKSETYFDSHNRQIISLLSQGIKTKNMPAYLGLSISAIDKRKAVIKSFFGIDKGSDEDIIKAAKKSGFV